jgi:hypothetical protein
MSLRQLWWLPLLLAAMALAWWVGGRLRPPADQVLAVDPACDVGQRSCSLPLPGGGRVGLSLSPLPPRVMQPMQVTVSVDGPATAVWVDFVGLNMDMGFNRAELAADPAGLWQGEVVLPVCSAAEMHWEARVVVVGQGRIEAPFRFSTRP